VVAVPSSLARNVVAAWGADGQRFLETLPGLLDAVTRQWGLTLVAPLPMSYHWVGRVRRADGSEAVLKLGPPTAVELRREVAALRHFDGGGAVRLLAADLPRGALLLELASPGEPARSRVPAMDLVATAAIITVMRRLHRPLPPEQMELPALPALAVRNRRTFATYLRRHRGDSPLPRRLVARAQELSDELCASAASRVVLHGDLHHDNVLRAARDPWLAIDPHGVVGDPGAEIAPLLYNPDPANRDPALTALVPARLDQLADGLGLDPDRVVAWGFVGAVLSAVWAAADPTAPATRALDVAQLLEPRL
jgi:streptomycin 6-kinase